MIMRTIFASLLFFAFAGCGDDAAPKTQNGEACELAEDCESSDCRQEIEGCHPFFGCRSYALPGGMCTDKCTWLEDKDVPFEELLQADCAEGEQCLGVNGDAESTVCFQGCETQEDCREDYVCTLLAGFSTCLPPSDAARVVQEDLLIQADPYMKATK